VIKIYHKTADVSEKAKIGENTKIWNWVQVRENSEIGKNCILSKGVYIDTGVKIGDNVKIQNNVSVYHGVTIENGVFVGPHVCFTNDKKPRAVNPDSSLKSPDDWIISEIRIKEGAAIGANSTIVCGITVGKWALIGAGSVVTKDVPDHGLVYGNPARLQGYVCRKGHKMEKGLKDYHCAVCKEKINI
jgi:UDP-2-acetamido-3-amino-2,3-dideoxy-glucuronate N-acetyltransferase